jgi:CubicO group peptidase (beta-lactamase class C family)
MKNILAIAMALVIISCNQSVKENKRTKQPKSEIIEIFTSLVKNDVKDDNIDGSFSLAIIHKDSILALESYGKADKNTIFRIGSISKSFAGFLMLQLQQDGMLDIGLARIFRTNGKVMLPFFGL